jgi:hypothetical protein
LIWRNTKVRVWCNQILSRKSEEGDMYRIMCAVAVGLLASAAIAAELRPLTLPSQSTNVQRGSSANQPSTGGVSEQVYGDFEAKVKTMKASEKDELIRTFTQKRNGAQRAEEAAHYQRLISILQGRP